MQLAGKDDGGDVNEYGHAIRGLYDLVWYCYVYRGDVSIEKAGTCLQFGLQDAGLVMDMDMDSPVVSAKTMCLFRHGCLCERHGGRPAVAVASGADRCPCREQGLR